MRDKQLYSLEAEQALLGAVMLDNAVIDRVCEIGDGDLYFGAHRTIWRAIRGLIRDGDVADAISVATRLQTSGDLENVGGLEYVGALVQAVASVSGSAAYAKVVRERALDRRLLEVSGDIAELAHSTSPIEQRIDKAQSLVMAIAESSVDRQPVLIEQLLYGLVEEIERRQERGDVLRGLTTSLTDLDKRLHGLQQSDLIIVAGRPSMGKTSLALQMALHNATHGKSVAFFSMEMSKEQIVEKAVANIGRLPLENIRTGKMSNDDYSRLSASLGRLNTAKFVIDDSGGLTVEQVRARARGIKRQHGLDMIVVDYLQLMSGDGDNRNSEVSEISRGLKALAKELQIPVVVLSQLNRALEQRSDKRPTMADLRDSGAIEQDADVIIFIYRDEVYNPNTQDKGVAELIVAKHRMGSIGRTGSSWLDEFGAFGDREWAPRSEDPPKRTARTYEDAF